MVFNITFNNISVISWRRKPEYPEKTTELSQVTYRLYHINVVSSTTGFKLTTLDHDQDSPWPFGSGDLTTQKHIYTCKVESSLCYFYPWGPVNEIWPIVKGSNSICFLNKVGEFWIVYLKIKYKLFKTSPNVKKNLY